MLPARFISRADADRRSITTIRLTKKLRACLVHGKALPRLGATAAVTAGNQDAARLWSRAIWERFSHIDAIQHRTRHDNDELALAVFHRASSALQVRDSIGIRANREWFASVLNRYRLGLVE
jgi:hypothetical protein